jgi:HK97 family phage prohead protease
MASNVERRVAPEARLQTRAEGDSPVVLQGYAAVFNSQTVLYSSPTTVVRETILPGAFRNALAEGMDVRALIDHDSSLIIGRTRANTLKLTEDAHGLLCEITPPDTQVARDLIENIRVGNVSQMSFAFIPRSGGETVTTTLVDGVTYQDIEITDVDLFDASVVTYPAYQDTSVSLRAQELADQARQHRWLETRRNRLRILEVAAHQ